MFIQKTKKLDKVSHTNFELLQNNFQLNN